VFKTVVTIERGDCDEAGIVFYPNYFYWFDCAFQRLLRSRGLSQRELRKRFGTVTPIVHAHCDFKAPARYDSELVMEVDMQPEGICPSMARSSALAMKSAPGRRSTPKTI
jgi:YbgC/YbaW family acyl-CoA thioester hydrolase